MCSHFFFLRNYDGSNYPFTKNNDVKNHVCLVSPAQSKKNPKVSAKTVVVPEHARPINRRDKMTKFYFVPDTIQTKSFCPRKWDKTVLFPEQIFVPGTELFNFLFVFGTKNVAMM
jgi:hypothetical protein